MVPWLLGPPKMEMSLKYKKGTDILEGCGGEAK